MAFYQELPVRTQSRAHWVDITRQVQEVVSASGTTEGLCHVSSLHTTAGMTINENADPDVGRDFFVTLEKMVPRHGDYHHSEGNSDSHLKASLVGFSVQVPIHRGELVLGTWQSIYFCEFDGPRSRTVSVMILD